MHKHNSKAALMSIAVRFLYCVATSDAGTRFMKYISAKIAYHMIAATYGYARCVNARALVHT